MNLTMGLRKAIAFGGDAEALVCGDVRLDHCTFVDRVARLAAALRDLGMGNGDRVAMLAANGQHYIEYYFGVLWGGGVIVPINSRFALPEMIEQIRDAGPTVLIVDGNFAEIGAQLAEAAPSVKALLYAGAGKAPGKALDYEAVLAGAHPCEDALRGGDDLACIFYTGGHHGPFEGRDAQPSQPVGQCRGDGRAPRFRREYGQPARRAAVSSCRRCAGVHDCHAWRKACRHTALHAG